MVAAPRQHGGVRLFFEDWGLGKAEGGGRKETRDQGPGTVPIFVSTKMGLSPLKRAGDAAATGHVLRPKF